MKMAKKIIMGESKEDNKEKEKRGIQQTYYCWNLRTKKPQLA